MHPTTVVLGQKQRAIFILLLLEAHFIPFINLINNLNVLQRFSTTSTFIKNI